MCGGKSVDFCDEGRLGVVCILVLCRWMSLVVKILRRGVSLEYWYFKDGVGFDWRRRYREDSEVLGQRLRDFEQEWKEGSEIVSRLKKRSTRRPSICRSIDTKTRRRQILGPLHLNPYLGNLIHQLLDQFILIGDGG